LIIQGGHTIILGKSLYKSIRQGGVYSVPPVSERYNTKIQIIIDNNKTIIDLFKKNNIFIIEFIFPTEGNWLFRSPGDP